MNIFARKTALNQGTMQANLYTANLVKLYLAGKRVVIETHPSLSSKFARKLEAKSKELFSRLPPGGSSRRSRVRERACSRGIAALGCVRLVGRIFWRGLAQRVQGFSHSPFVTRRLVPPPSRREAWDYGLPCGCKACFVGYPTRTVEVTKWQNGSELH